jgi:hypothetical protein
MFISENKNYTKKEINKVVAKRRDELRVICISTQEHTHISGDDNMYVLPPL